MPEDCFPEDPYRNPYKNPWERGLDESWWARPLPQEEFDQEKERKIRETLNSLPKEVFQMNNMNSIEDKIELINNNIQYLTSFKEWIEYVREDYIFSATMKAIKKVRQDLENIPEIRFFFDGFGYGVGVEDELEQLIQNDVDMAVGFVEKLVNVLMSARGRLKEENKNTIWNQTSTVFPRKLGSTNVEYYRGDFHGL